ncbi:MAG: DUF1194 domain-containing protein [Geminicoccaceae bacterium]|nr:DUF1194 domain-containing protein [Geminicoccaceae bacterium]
MTARWRLGLALFLLAAAGPPASAQGRGQDRPVDLELVLAVDVSWSMDEEEQRLQREGYVEALRSEEILSALRSGAYGRVGLAYVEWAGVADQRVVVPWGIVEDRGSLDAFAARLEAAPLRRSAFTAIGDSLAFTAGLFAGNGMEGARRAVDVSGDGPNNVGPPVVPARDAVVAEGIVVNGLPLMLRPGSPGVGTMPNLDVYYEDCVIGGPGAFSLPVRERSEIKAAIQRKLVTEIAGVPPRAVPAAFAGNAPRIDCQIGVKAMPSWMIDP